MKKALSLLLASFLLMPCLSACTDETDKLPNVVIIDVKDFGKITVELRSEERRVGKECSG